MNESYVSVQTLGAGDTVEIATTEGTLTFRITIPEQCAVSFQNGRREQRAMVLGPADEWNVGRIALHRSLEFLVDLEDAVALIGFSLVRKIRVDRVGAE